MKHKCWFCGYEMTDDEYESAYDEGCPSCRHKRIDDEPDKD